MILRDFLMCRGRSSGVAPVKFVTYYGGADWSITPYGDNFSLRGGVCCVRSQQ